MNLISPRRVLALAVVALGLLAAPSAQAFPYQPITGTQFFTPDGVWNKPLATNAPLGSWTPPEGAVMFPPGAQSC